MTMNTTDSATVTTQTDDVETCRIGANATSGPPKTIETKPRCSKNLWIFLVTIAVSFVAGSIVTMVLVLPENRSSSQTTKDDAATETNPTTSQEGTTTTTGPTTTTTTIGDPNSPPYWDIRYKYIANENDNDVGGTQCVVDPNDPHCILSHDTAYYGTTKSYSNGDVFCNFKVLQDGYSLKMDLFDTVWRQDKLELHGLFYSGMGVRFDGYPIEAGDTIIWNSDEGAETQPELGDHVRAGWRICLVSE